MFAYFMGSIVILCLGIQYIMLNRLEKLQADYNSLAIHDLNDLSLKIESLLQSQRTNIAFTAFLSKHATELSLTQTVPFNEVEINEGQGFNTNTHIFTCPVPGIYVFHTGLLSMPKSRVIADIVKEGKQLVQAHAEPGGANYDQGFTSVITNCDKGENVWVRISYGNAVFSGRYTTFSGFLLWESK